MAIKTIVDSLEDIPEALHAEYTEQDGKFVLQLDGIDAHPSVVNLKNAHERTKADKRKLSDDLNALKTRFDGLPDDFDAEAYEELRSQAEGKEPPRTDEQVARLRDQLERKHANEIGKKDDRITGLEGTVRRILIDDGLTKALLEANVAKEFLPAAKALLKEKGVVKLHEDDGQFEATVETDMGPLPLAKYVSEWASGDEGKMFVSKPTGGDAKGGNGQRLGENPFDTQGGKVKPNLTRQQELIASNPEKARQMAKAAGISPAW